MIYIVRLKSQSKESLSRYGLVYRRRTPANRFSYWADVAAFRDKKEALAKAASLRGNNMGIDIVEVHSGMSDST